MLSNFELKLTKEDWNYFLHLKSRNLSATEIDQALHDFLLPRMRALFNSDELLECEKKENLLSLDEYIKQIQQT